MTRTRFAAVAAVFLGTAVAANAQPQPPIQASRPTYSPYLNLLRGGASPGINYLGLVQPQQQVIQQQNQMAKQIQQNNQAIQSVNQAVQGADENIPGTGHAAVFNNTLHYFGGQPGAMGGNYSAGRSMPRPGSNGPGGTTGSTASRYSGYSGTAGNGIPRR
jgi:hypothetical protein